MRCANHEGAYLASTCWKHHLMPKESEEPVELWANQYCGQTAMYYLPEQLQPSTEEYYKEQQEAYRARCREKSREYRRWQKKLREEARLNEILRPRTAWQWLSQKHRKVMPGAMPFSQTYKLRRFDEDYGFYTKRSKPWYYYNYCDTIIVTNDEYEQLKAAYIKKYGGWEHIDLKNTTYDGHAWY